MNLKSFSALWVWCISIGSNEIASQEFAARGELDLPVEVAFMDLERIVMKLDRLIWRLLKMREHKPEGEENTIEVYTRRMFGIPVKTELQWKKLAEKVKRKEKKRDMKHWKQSLIYNKIDH
ncbi:uncharacterized protein Eint_060355 [Encephalitozoon intestinalis ATCC 50506]|uniref:Uncharacterized protein n=1 Tax=Encephalitozoon intestinalis (strain ATCC 50506) TaxID=876142 RepID=W8Q1W7_ENCIT|nr:uncharacterized protein Eint_060355 [Encephalitozoon intestinalis ATCC 50506]AHL30114.1 hypothetical protein Eint_060355 [Encephalitozoon intestinalis ATCC 50506]UTX45377.1 hypothetical protein GPK93_06g09290 [Encephalitozoon intestinalis]